jgi:carboxypeptidase Q
MNYKHPRLALALSWTLLASCAAFDSSATARTEEAALLVPAGAPHERVIALAQDDNRVQDHLRHLTLGIGPRLTGSSNLQRAEMWCRDQFASFGLDARLEPWGEFAVGFERGHSSGSMLEPDHVELVFTTPAWTPGTDGPRRGPVLAWPEDQAALDALDEKVAGAWILRTGTQRPQTEWRETVDAALVAGGAAGVISAARGTELVHTSGNPRITPDALPKLVSIVLRADQHADLAERMAKGEALELEFDIDNRFVEGPVILNNVVADLPGSELPDEYVILCAHLDSWDGAQGALDNGTGVSTTLEAARLLARAGVAPRRTIRFILWSGEEQGLLGSKAWVEAHAAEMERISAVFNHDGGTNYLSGLSVTPEMMPSFEAICAPLVDLSAQMPFELREVEALSGASSSDQAPFVEAGVPGFFWGQSGRSDYDRHHHTQYDTFDAAIPSYQRHSAVVAALVAQGLADAETLLDRRNMAPIEARRLGVSLDGVKVTRVMEDGRGAAAGWLEGDEIQSIDGEPVASRRELSRLLQAGGPRKTIVLLRAGEPVETVVDWTDDPAEGERERRAAERAAAKPR